MNQSENINELAASLSKMQGQIGSVTKNKTAKIPTKSGSTYSYSYADLAGIWECIRSPLSEHGLAITQTFESSHLITTLIHSSGQWIKSALPLTYTGLKPQELGSEITYLRRYALCSILGISADEDDDATLAQNARNSKVSHKEFNKDTISATQLKELRDLFSQCDPLYFNQVMNHLKKSSSNIDSLEEVPLSLYERIKNAAIKKSAEYQKEISQLEVANV